MSEMQADTLPALGTAGGWGLAWGRKALLPDAHTGPHLQVALPWGQRADREVCTGQGVPVQSPGIGTALLGCAPEQGATPGTGNSLQGDLVREQA